MKITKEQIIQIRKLREEGLTQKEISNKLNIPISTVQYYSEEKNRLRSINYQKEYQKKNPPKRDDKYREYQRIYHNKRYHKLKKEKEKKNE